MHRNGNMGYSSPRDTAPFAGSLLFCVLFAWGSWRGIVRSGLGYSKILSFASGYQFINQVIIDITVCWGATLWFLGGEPPWWLAANVRPKRIARADGLPDQSQSPAIVPTDTAAVSSTETGM